MLISSNSALNESKVVKLPGPAIIGNAIGTIDAVSGTSFLYIDIPILISSAIKKIINENKFHIDAVCTKYYNIKYWKK